MPLRCCDALSRSAEVLSANRCGLTPHAIACSIVVFASVGRSPERPTAFMTRRAAAANAVSPLSFPPCGIPLSGTPLSSKDHTKGGKPRGAPARRLLWRPSKIRAPRRPPGCRRHTAAFPPCAFGPQGPGAWVRPEPAQTVQVFARCPAFRGIAYGDLAGRSQMRVVVLTSSGNNAHITAPVY